MSDLSQTDHNCLFRLENPQSAVSGRINELKISGNSNQSHMQFSYSYAQQSCQQVRRWPLERDKYVSGKRMGRVLSLHVWNSEFAAAKALVYLSLLDKIRKYKISRIVCGNVLHKYFSFFVKVH